MDAALAAGDSRKFVANLGQMARVRGMSRVAQETGLAREALYRALSANPPSRNRFARFSATRVS